MGNPNLEIIMKSLANSKTGSEALLNAIWQKFGGPAALRFNYFPNISPQNFINWRLRGRVPLTKVGPVANTLKIPKWGLNYEELSIMFPDEIPLWNEVVKSYNLGKRIEDIVLYLEPPKRWIDG